MARRSQSQKLTMYEKLTKEDIKARYFKDRNSSLHEFSINTTHFLCSEHGLLFRQMKTGYWKEIQNTKNHAKGYNVVLVNKKQYSRAKLILFAFNKINLDDKHNNIYHKNMNRLDCKLDNLTLKIPPIYKPKN